MLKKIISVFLCFAAAFTITASVEASVGGYTAEAASSSEISYYYNQMSDEAKAVYDELKEAVLECRKQITVNVDIDRDDFDMIAELLILHDPMTFNISDMTATNVTRRSATFNITYNYKKETFDKMTEAYEKRANTILSKLTDDMTTYEKIKKIHDLIIKNAEYDLDSPTSSSIYGTLVKKKGKCDGYARTFSYICGKAGINTVTVIGDDLSQVSDDMHMWNKVYYKNRWYNVDVTWDDPVSNLKENMKYDFFMVSDRAIKNTHSEIIMSFDVPAADDDSKDYYTVYKKSADDLDGAKSLMKREIKSAVKAGKSSISFKCSSKKTFEQVKAYVLDTTKVSSMLKSVKNSTKSNLADSVYSYTVNDNQNIIRLLIFYEDTDINDYFSDLDTISDEMMSILAEYGIT